MAGYGIAIPVGAIAILIIETGIRRGFGSGFSAGAGAASADLIYAAVAAIVGAQLATALSGMAGSIRAVSAVALVVIGLWGIWRARARQAGPSRTSDFDQRYPRIYLRFLGLTLLNPLTVAYFTALILGLGSLGELDAAGRVTFVAGAGLASLSWQTLLAGLGGLGNRFASERARRLTAYLGNAIVIGLGVRLLIA